MKKLLSIKNLKKYFPLAKTGIFQKEQLYVRANEDISIDIYEGETFGLVGESGCGKSTLGRVLLQLYDQTAGSTMYYGRTLGELAPKYVSHTLTHADAYLDKLAKANEKAKVLTEKCEGLGDTATFYDLQERNLAIADAKTALDQISKILGGFMVKETKEGSALLLEKHNLEVKIAALNEKISEENIQIELLEHKEDAAAKVASHKAKAESLIADREKLVDSIKEIDEKINAIKANYKDDEEFVKYEEMLDDGIDLARLSKHEMSRLRKDLQIVFQDPYSSLNPRMTVGQIIEEGLITHKMFKAGSSKMKEYVFSVMQACGLQNYMYNRYPHQFSGGQRQRICIARALAVNPKFVVCDECVSALDVSIQSQIINLLQELKNDKKLTYLFISHNLSVVRYISDRIGVMYLGNMVEVADTDTLFKDPRHPYTIALLSSIPTTDPESLSKERIILEGNIPSPIKPSSGCKFHTRCYMACEDCKRVPPPLVEVEPGHFVACHFLDRKVDENGNYLFKVAKETHAR